MGGLEDIARRLLMVELDGPNQPDLEGAAVAAISKVLSKLEAERNTTYQMAMRRKDSDAQVARDLVREWELQKRPLFGAVTFNLAAFVVGRLRDAHEARVRELLEANNAYLERARQAEGGALVKRMLGCATVEELLEACSILEELRQDEGTTICLFCDNPDFGPGPDAALDVNWALGDFPVRFDGDNLLECLRKAKAGKP